MRLFLAIFPPTELLERIGSQLSLIRADLPRASWVRPASMHLTVLFLGDQDRCLLRRTQALGNALQRMQRVVAEVTAVGGFPNVRRPRVVWLGLRSARHARSGRELGCLRDAVLGALPSMGVDGRLASRGSEWRPHLTLARTRARWGINDIERVRKALAEFEGSSFEVEAVDLVASIAHARGRRYEVLERFSLNSGFEGDAR